MQSSLEDFARKGFTLYVVSMGKGDDLEYLGGLGHKILMNEGPAWDTYGIYYVPHTFFVDKNGVIAETTVGWGGDSALAAFNDMVDQLTGN